MNKDYIDSRIKELDENIAKATASVNAMIGARQELVIMLEKMSDKSIESSVSDICE